MVTRHKISSKDETPIVEQKKYKSMIGGLQYMTHTRLDIENVVGIIARFQDNLKESHYVVVKRIFRYLKVTLEFGLQYDRSNDFTLYTYIDVDQAVMWMIESVPLVEHFLLEEDWFIG